LIPAHITWLVERRHHDPMVSKSYFPGILQSFRWTMGSLAGVADDAPRHAASRIIAVLWGFVCIIFIAYYTATLTANITVGKFEAQIKSPSDLVGKKVCTVAGTTSAGALDEFGVTFDGVATIEDCYRGLDDGKFQAAVYDAPVLRYHANREGRGTVELVGQVIRAEEYGMAFRNGSDLRKQADEALLSMFEDGEYYVIQSKWFGSDLDGGSGNG
jgi:polar amino acid transport system substrate-binding protein